MEVVTKGQYNDSDLKDHKGVAGIIMKDGKVLMLYHNKLDMWTIPVGKVDDGLTTEESMKIELQEEIGIKVKSMCVLGEFSHTYLRNNIDVKIDSIIYIILDYDGRVKNNEPHKHKELKWMAINELGSHDLSQSTVEFLKLLK